MRQPFTLPPDVRLMNTFAVVLGWLFAGIVLALLGSWLIHRPVFFLSSIKVQGELMHNNAVTLRANVAPKLEGNFLTVDLQAVRAVFETVPWVRRAVVKREFPNHIKVVLYEHKAIAFWGSESDARMVNSQGEVFEANPGDVETEELPTLNGPPGTAPVVLKTYQRLAVLFDDMHAVLEHLQLDGQGSWHARLDSGAVIELGHGTAEELEKRTRRFIATVPEVSSRFGRDVESADLRYPHGYALKLRGVTTSDGVEKDAPHKR